MCSSWTFSASDHRKFSNVFTTKRASVRARFCSSRFAFLLAAAESAEARRPQRSSVGFSSSKCSTTSSSLIPFSTCLGQRHAQLRLTAWEVFTATCAGNRATASSFAFSLKTTYKIFVSGLSFKILSASFTQVVVFPAPATAETRSLEPFASG